MNSTLVGIVRLHLEQHKLCEALSGADNGAPMCEGAATLCNMQVTPPFSRQLLGCTTCLWQLAGGSGLCLSYKQYQMLLFPFAQRRWVCSLVVTACWQPWLAPELPALANGVADTALALHAGHHQIWDLFSSTDVGSVLLSVCVLPPVSDTAKLGQQELQESETESESDAAADAAQAAAGQMCLLQMHL